MSELKIYPSLLAADFGHLHEGVKRAERAGADGLHLDIMDGHFVPNISMGPAVVEMARRSTPMHLDVHLMMSRPQDLLQDFINAGSDTILIHVESDCDCHAVLADIKAAGRRCGVTINPDTPANAVDAYLEQCDEILVMSVHPGFGGQTFIPAALDKLSSIRDSIASSGRSIDLEIDGGINGETGPQAVRAGANILVAGSHLYQTEDMSAGIRNLRDGAGTS